MQFFNTGIYTISDVAKYSKLPSQRVRGWVASADKVPLIKKEIPHFDKNIYLSFYDLMEIRFIKYFLDKGVKRNQIFAAYKKARKELHKDNPFATKFTTDGLHIYADNEQEGHSQRLLDILQEQFTFYELLKKDLTHGIRLDYGVSFDENDRPSSWKPSPDKLPLIILNPRFSFGKPIVEPDNLPTYTLADAVKAENGNIQTVADWYGISSEAVRQAVVFEHNISS